MSSSGTLTGNILGKGIRFPGIDSIFIARGGAVAIGDIRILAEDGTGDAAEVTGAGNTNSDVGTLANTIPPSATSELGLAGGAGVEAAVFLLALEAAADDGIYRAAVEAYFVDAKVTTAAARNVRTALFSVSGVANDTRSGIGSCAIARLVVDVGSAITATLTKVHFCGFPGGFGNGPGAT